MVWGSADQKIKQGSGGRAHVWISACLCLCLLWGNFGYSGEAGPAYRVVRVFDGDTLQIRDKNRLITVRLAGIDAPETGRRNRKGQPYSQKAKVELEKQVLHQPVRLKQYGTDSYGRLLAEVFAGQTNVNLEMIQKGLAEVYRGRKPDALDAETYLREETLARKAQKGIWQQGTAYESPRRWRRNALSD